MYFTFPIGFLLRLASWSIPYVESISRYSFVLTKSSDSGPDSENLQALFELGLDNIILLLVSLPKLLRDTFIEASNLPFARQIVAIFL